jgi:hypothetical protein
VNEQDSDARAEFVAERAAQNPRWKDHEPAEPKLAVVRCFACGEQFAVRPSFATKAELQTRRQFCPTPCWSLWSAALMKARHAVRRRRASRDIDALRAALEIGREFETELAKVRPRKFGRRPRPLGIDLAIEALHVSKALSQKQILLLLQRELAVAAPLNERYVERRCDQARIRRRVAA